MKEFFEDQRKGKFEFTEKGLKAKKLPELKKIMEENGIKINVKDKKDDLIKKILAHLKKSRSSSSKQPGKFEFTEQEGETSTPPSGGGSGSASSGGGTPSSYPQVSKWESGRTMGKTYGGPGYKWESGRTMGKTYGGSNYKWFTGLKRGKANQAKES